MLPIQPKFTSSTPMAMFRGQRHQAALLSHLQSPDPIRYDSLLVVNHVEWDEFCFIVSLESAAPGQPLGLAVYAESGRRAVSPKDGKPLGRRTFLDHALGLVEEHLHERLMFWLPAKAPPPIEEKPLKAFYPDEALRHKLHYCFAHQWLPAYARSDPARFFGYFERGEVEPTRFIQARWQMMEGELGVTAPPAPGQMVIRRVSDLQMSVELPAPATSANQAIALRRPIAIVQMPAPEFMTYAYFVGIVLDPAQPNGIPQSIPEARVFTLEQIEGRDDRGRFCEWKRAEKAIEHFRYQTLVAPQRDEFIRAIRESLGSPTT
jgi:hypothetical protein